MSKVDIQISCATSFIDVESGLPLLPRQYAAVACCVPWLSVHAAVTQRSSTLCAYATWIHEFSCISDAEGACDAGGRPNGETADGGSDHVGVVD